MKTQPGLEMRYRPEDNYSSGQNPPDFSWPYIEGADGYDLIVCRDRTLKDIAYKKENNKTNYYNFPFIFTPGMYYWSVRHHINGEASAWCKARRFLLRADATEFPVPDIDTLLSRIPAGHPRIYTNEKELEKFRREMLAPGNAYFDMIRRALKAFMKKPFPDEKSVDPLHSDEYNMYSPFQHAADNIKRACNMAMYAAFYYLVTEDAEVGRYGVECLMKLAGWDPHGATSYAVNDQGHRRVAVYSALAYDWLKPLMTPEQCEKLLAMIEIRVNDMCSSNEFNISVLDKSPFDAHGVTAIGYVLLIGLACYKDIPAAEGWLKYTLPLFINFMYPWGGEDGAWAHGTYYWSCNIFGKKVQEALLSTGVIDVYRKMWQQNEIYYPLYFQPEGSVGAFGDNSYIPATGKFASQVSMMALRLNTPEAKWLRNQYGYLTAYGHTDDSDPSVCCHDRLFPAKEAYLPEYLANDHYMKDVGLIAMHSDLADPERVSIFFRSSWYGSFNHSHADQNSFIIQAYGEPLAIDSGYYDLYNYPFDKDYTRKTYAHNAITYNNGCCQSPMDISAKGKITDFLSHKHYALAGGDAVQAYKGVLGRALRRIIYIKPDMAVVIDDLAAAQGEMASFEFWLNAQKWLHLYEDGRGGKAVKDRAALDVRVHYPEMLTAFYSADFTGTDGEPLYPVFEGHARWLIQKRMWFQTEKTEATKMITTLDIHKSGTQARPVASRVEKDYMYLGLPEDTSVYVNLGNTAVVEAENIQFSGEAVLCAPGALMLISGTRLAVDGITVFEADSPVSAIIGGKEFSVSSIEHDALLHLHAPGIKKVRNHKGREVDSGSVNIGATVVMEDEYAVFRLYNGAYSFRLE